jgi:hypothetical protein
VWCAAARQEGQGSWEGRRAGESKRQPSFLCDHLKSIFFSFSFFSQDPTAIKTNLTHVAGKKKKPDPSCSILS